MVLRADESYTAANDITKVIEGAVTPEQEAWHNENSGRPIDEITHFPLTPAQILYIALCKNGFKLQEALESCDLNEDEAAEAKTALNILDANGVVKKITRPSFVGADLQGYDLEEADLEGADLRNANLRVANLQWAKLQEADLRNADLRGADLRVAVLYRADLRRADLRRADLRYANLRDADLRGAEMQGANLQEARLQWAELRGANLQDADLRDAGLYKAQMQEADLQGADLRRADLRRADLRGADISGANFEDAKNLDAANIDAASIKLAFYCQDNPPNNLALSGVNAKQHPMALTKQEYDNVCRLRDLNNPLAFEQELDRLRVVCDTRIDSQQQVDADLKSLKDLDGRGGR